MKRALALLAATIIAALGYASAQQKIGYVLALEGTWTLSGETHALTLGQSLPAMGLLVNRAPLDGDNIVEIGNYEKMLDLAERNSRGDYSSTITEYQKILETQPQLPLAHYKLAQAYFQSENYPAAMEQFKMALALSKDSVGPSFGLALTYQKLGRIDDAILGFKQTLELDPGHYEARVNLGVLLTGSNKLPEAIDELQKAVTVAPNSTSALSALGIAYSLNGENDRGVEAMKRALRRSPSDAFLHANLGAIYKRMGRTVEAEEQFAIAQRLRPGFFKSQ